MSPLFVSDESVKSVINHTIPVDSVCSVDYLFSTEVIDEHGGELTKTMTMLFTLMSTDEYGGMSASGRLGERGLP